MNCYKCATPVPDNARFCSACGTDVSGDSHTHVRATPSVEHERELFNKLQAELGAEYILERELGRGGMAVVYLGHDALLNRKIAVKVLPPELTYGSSSIIERFKREAQTAAKLDHPNIIPVHRVSPGGKLFWYVMKYLDGEALNDILEREGQLPVERTVDIVGQVAAALDYAHQNQVVHRDVKPANVLVDKRGWCTVTDFGIAKALDANTLTASGSIIGTPYYMSPEQCKGKKVGAAADQYSLAVMTYQMLGGHVPFTGDSAVEIVHKHVADPVPPLGVLRPNLSAKVIAVVERGLAKTAEERFATVAEFAKALKAASEGVNSAVAPPKKTGGPRMSKTALVSPVPGVLRTAKGTWRERKGLVFGILGGLAVVAGIAVSVVVRPWERVGPAPVVDTTTVAPPIAAGRQRAVQDSVAAADSVRRADSLAAAARLAGTSAARASLAASMAGIVLRGAPAGATITLDGRRMRGPRFQAEGGRRHTVSVAKPGFETWTESLTPQAGEQLTVPVTMRPAVVAGPPPATMGRLFVTAVPTPTRILVNGQPFGSSIPNRDFPPGTYVLRFEGADDLGPWYAERSVEIRAGEPTRLTRVPLQIRRP
jgi:serine/threonine protein kinase